MRPGAWRLLRDPPEPAAWNMAVDEALLLCAAEQGVTLRLYTWRRPALSLGYRRTLPVPETRLSTLGVDGVRRVTGGGAVLHAGDLTYAVAAPRGLPELPDDLEGSHARIREAVLAGLRSLGLDARPSLGTPTAERLDLCFAGSTASEIQLAARKLVGSAQRRTSPAFLQHGSIRLRDERALYRALLGEDPGPPPIGLADLDAEKVAVALIAGFATLAPAGLAPGRLSDEERAIACERAEFRRRQPLGVPPLDLKKRPGIRR